MASNNGLPELSNQYLSAGKLHSTARQPLTSKGSPPAQLSHTISPTTFQRCSSPTLRGAPLRRSVELMRVSRSEWDHRDQLLSTLRAENHELQQKLRDKDECTENYHQLLRTCHHMLDTLGTVSSDMTRERLQTILTSKITELKEDHEHSKAALSTSCDELEKTRGELAANSVKLNNLQTQLVQLKTLLSTKDTELQQLKGEVELGQQSNARTSAMLQSLKKQLTSYEEEKEKKRQNLSQFEQTIGQLQKQLKDKETDNKIMKDQLHQLEIEKDETKERASVADAAYEEICSQLAESLQVEDMCDVDQMITKVGHLMKENHDLVQRIETLTQSSQVVELDAKANRETILRLVAEVKKYENQQSTLTSLQEQVKDLKEQLEICQKEKASLLERLTVTRDTMNLLQQELHQKEESCVELKHNIEIIQESHQQEQQSQQQYVDFYTSLKSSLSCQSSSEIKQTIQELLENVPQLKTEISQQNTQLLELKDQLKYKDRLLTETQDNIEIEKSKITDLTSQLKNIEILERQLHQQNEKYNSFIKRCMTSLQVETSTSCIVTGDFAEDAVLVRAEQLSKLGTQAIAEKQSAVYSLQRRLKLCRQQLDSKEMHVNLLQKKVSALEARVTSAIEKETEWQSALDKGKKTSQLLDKLQLKITQQRDTIAQLKEDSESLQKLKSICTEQEDRIQQLERQVQTLQETRVNLSQQLAEARHKIHSVVSQDKDRAEHCEEQLRRVQDELESVRQREQKMRSFQTSIYEAMDTPPKDDNDVLLQIKQVQASCQKYKELSHDLQASLRQLENGFRTSYQDTITLLCNEI